MAENVPKARRSREKWRNMMKMHFIIYIYSFATQNGKHYSIDEGYKYPK
jgi:hypothetical protein